MYLLLLKGICQLNTNCHFHIFLLSWLSTTTVKILFSISNLWQFYCFAHQHSMCQGFEQIQSSLHGQLIVNWCYLPMRFALLCLHFWINCFSQTVNFPYVLWVLSFLFNGLFVNFPHALWVVTVWHFPNSFRTKLNLEVHLVSNYMFCKFVKKDIRIDGGRLTFSPRW